MSQLSVVKSRAPQSSFFIVSIDWASEFAASIVKSNVFGLISVVVVDWVPATMYDAVACSRQLGQSVEDVRYVMSSSRALPALSHELHCHFTLPRGRTTGKLFPGRIAVRSPAQKLPSLE